MLAPHIYFENYSIASPARVKVRKYLQQYVLKRFKVKVLIVQN